MFHKNRTAGHCSDEGMMTMVPDAAGVAVDVHS